MTGEEQQRMKELCQRITFEKDPMVFDKLLNELDDLLSIKAVTSCSVAAVLHRSSGRLKLAGDDTF